MPAQHHARKGSLATSLRVGWFLAYRDIRHANKWTTMLIVAVMVLTFLNLIVVSGILVGLIQGSIDAYSERYLGDVIISTLPNKHYIENSADIINFARSLPGVAEVSPRYVAAGTVEANYRTKKRQTDITEGTAGIVAGIDPIREEAVTRLSKYIVEGSFLAPGDYDEILVGANLLYKYNNIDSADVRTLKNVEVGSKVRLIVASTTREVTIKGVLKSKIGEIDQRVIMVDSQLRQLMRRYDYNVGEIAIRLKPGTSPEAVRDEIIAFVGADQAEDTASARIQTASEGQPKFVTDIKTTMTLLGNMIGSIGLAVASITIFIVIFVNAITRRRYIGIMKGIGVNSSAIEFSYILQSIFYATCGMALGSLIVFAFLKPFIAAHPIDFPFSDGVLVATAGGTLVRIGVLFVATMIAGYIPAKLVVRQNTLSAILGR